MNPSNELEQAVVANPGAPDAYLVYGDWLIEEGDPRGELVSVQAALEAKPNDPQLQRRERELLATHERRWLGDLVELFDDGQLDVAWRYGFLDSVRLGRSGISEADAADAYAVLCELPVARFLRHLELRVLDVRVSLPSYAAVVGAMGKLGMPATLGQLAFTRHEYAGWSSLGDLSTLYPQLERLEELRLHVVGMRLGQIVLPNLRRFELVTRRGFTRDNLRSLMCAKWPKLADLVLSLGDELGDLSPKELRRLLDGEGTPSLKHLALSNMSMGDDILKAITGANVTRQLATLELSGVVSDDAAEELVDGAKALAHLERIELRRHDLSESMVQSLMETFGSRVVL